MDFLSIHKGFNNNIQKTGTPNFDEKRNGKNNNILIFIYRYTIG